MQTLDFGSLLWRADQGGENQGTPAPLSDLRQVPCLILLGAAGSGKTTELRREAAALTKSGAAAILVPLHTVRNPGDLASDVEQDSGFVIWAESSTKPLFLLLDGLDEAGVDIKRLVASIGVFARRLLGIHGAGRVALRLTSRPTAFPAEARAALADVFGASDLEVRHLQDLAREQIQVVLPREALYLLNDPMFAPLLATPLGLRLVLSAKPWAAQRQHGAQSRVAFFESCARALLAEPNDNRDDTPDHEVAMVVAGRVAVIALVCNRSSIQLRDHPDQERATSLSVHEIEDGRPEIVRCVPRPVTIGVLRKVLDRPLFEADGSGFVTFQHRGLMEFVAARYLAERQQPDQIRSLVSSEGAITPQLYGLVSWLLALDRRFFDLLLDDDSVPATLYLNCELADLDGDRRQRVVRRLIAYAASPQARSTPWRYDYESLPHWRCPEAELEIKQTLDNRALHEESRRTAVWLARKIDAAGLVGLLVDAAIGTGEALSTRQEAIRAVARFGNPDQRKQLLILAQGMDDDLDDELKGEALRALWPVDAATRRAVSIDDILKCLTPRKQQSFFGAYWSFIHDLPRQLHPDDWTAVLAWMQPQFADCRLSSRRRHHGWDFDDLFTGACEAAGDLLENEPFRRALAAVAVERVLDHKAPLAGAAVAAWSDQQRRLLIRQIVATWPDDAVRSPGELGFRLIHGDGPRLLKADDWTFVVEQVADVRSLAHWLQLADAICRFGGFADWPALTGVQAIDDLVAGLRQEYVRRNVEWTKLERSERRAEQKRTKKAAEKPAAERVEEVLLKVESGQVGEWWRLNFYLTDKGDGEVAFDEELDLRAAPGWQAADAAMRTRLKAAALRFAVQETPIDTWTDGKTLPYAVAAGLRAWLLLLEEGAELPLDKGVWQRWIDVMVRWPFSSNGARHLERFRGLISAAFERDPVAVRTSIEKAIVQGPVTWDLFLERYQGMWTEELIRLALDRAWGQGAMSDNEPNKPDGGRIRWVAAALTKERHAEVQRWLMEHVSANTDPRWAAALAGALNTPHARAFWTDFKKRLFADDKLLSAVMERLCEMTYAERSILADLAEEEQGQLLSRLDRLYPRFGDPDHRGATSFHAVSADEEVREFRDRLVVRLRDWGTQAAIDALREYRMTAADPDFADRIIADAERRMRSQTWRPRRPEEVLKILAATTAEAKL